MTGGKAFAANRGLQHTMLMISSPFLVAMHVLFAFACVCVCVRACVRAFVRACMRACVYFLSADVVVLPS